MTETKRQALDMLAAQYEEGRITSEEYAALTLALQEGPPFGDSDARYKVFLIDGAFVDGDDSLTDVIHLDDVDYLELGMLLRIAMRQDFDMVIRLAVETAE